MKREFGYKVLTRSWGATGSASENYHLRLLTSSPQRRQKPSLVVRHTGNATLHWRSAEPVAPHLMPHEKGLTALSGTQRPLPGSNLPAPFILGVHRR